MENKIIDCKAISAKIDKDISQKATDFKLKTGIIPTLATVLVGDNPASMIYVSNKVKKAKKLGMENILYHLKAEITEKKLIKLIEELNTNHNIHGILVQLPLPQHIDPKKILLKINSNKDVDGLHPLNQGLLGLEKNLGHYDVQKNYQGFAPCTPMGCMSILNEVAPDLVGKTAVVVGRSNLVGAPVAQILLNNDCTVFITHSKTQNLKDLTNMADVLILAIGKPGLIDASYVKEGAVIIDVGISKVNDEIVGDANMESVLPKVSAITPVPNGVGRLTVTCLMANLLKACEGLVKK